MSNRMQYASAADTALIKKHISQNTNKMFVGNEVEYNSNFGARTLFVQGIRSVDEILANVKLHKCQHVFFCANYTSPEKFTEQWAQMIHEVCQHVNATVDCETSAVASLVALGLDQVERLDIQLRVTVPHAQRLAKNPRVYIKIDDQLPRTGEGVWTMLFANCTQTGFTSWRAYADDEFVE